MTALLLGSLSTIIDTSELQREAFNDAFTEHQLDWHWDRDSYVELLRSSGGAVRLAEQAARLHQEVDADAVHATKSALLQARLAEGRLQPRPGVADSVRLAKESGLQVALVTTTSPANVAALLAGLGSSLPAGDLDLVVDATMVDRGKPDPAAYVFALRRLGEDPQQCVAVEDNLPGVRSALDAEVACVAFPNENTQDHDFSAAAAVVAHLDLASLLTHLRT